MSRLGKLPVIVPAGVTVTLTPDGFTAKGPKGEVSEVLPRSVSVTQNEGQLTVTVQKPDQGSQRALWGLARQLLHNAVTGVHAGFSKKLELSGIGFKAQVEGSDVVLSLGFSHPVRFPIPVGTTITVEKNTITITGASKQLVGQAAANLRSLKPPEPYKGKGIKYSDEIVRRKAGKVVKSAGAK